MADQGHAITLAPDICTDHDHVYEAVAEEIVVQHAIGAGLIARQFARLHHITHTGLYSRLDLATPRLLARG